MTDQLPLADVQSRLSELVDGVEAEHRRIVITRHGKPAAVLIAPDDLDALEDTLDLLSDAEAMASLRRAQDDIAPGRVERLSEDEARARWTRD